MLISTEPMNRLILASRTSNEYKRLHMRFGKPQATALRVLLLYPLSFTIFSAHGFPV